LPGNRKWGGVVNALLLVIKVYSVFLAINIHLKASKSDAYIAKPINKADLFGERCIRLEMDGLY
jgi:hypothetical protein